MRFSLKREFIIIEAVTGCAGGDDRQCHVWAGGVDTGSTQLGYIEHMSKKKGYEVYEGLLILVYWQSLINSFD